VTYFCSIGSQILYIFETHGIGQTPSSLERYLVLEKSDDLFSHRLWKVMTFLAVVSSPLPSSHVVYPVFFLHSGVTPWRVSPGAVPPSDATAGERTYLLHSEVGYKSLCKKTN